MEMIILMGVQASGKSTFCKERFFDTHVRVNLDMLRTRHRESVFVTTCLETRQPLVIDNTNPTCEDRQRYIAPAKAAGFRVLGYYFQSRIEDCQRRNAGRPESARVPSQGVLGTYSKMELPRFEEGFDELYYVRIADDGQFAVEEWSDEV
ncbi:MAG: AAA family ATPase [Pirellulales bacterium]|nr:AAA family ATPase [Pirellulales bacterium]